jgi:hypothetical protein
MPAFLTTATRMQCPHGGTVSAVSSNTKTKADGAYVLRASDTFAIAGCPLNVAGAPHPCMQVRWSQPAAKCKATGDFILTQTSIGQCIAADQAVQGVLLIQSTQSKVSGL